MKRGCLSIVLTLCTLSAMSESVTVTEIDGSGDHRIFCVGALTRVLLEPVVWRLADTGRIDLNAAVTDCLTTPIPPEYERLTLRDLHAGQAALPDDAQPISGETPHAALVRCLWSLRTRVDFAFGSPRPSKVASALFWVAVSERLGLTLDQLLTTYLVEPYGLKDTSFLPVEARQGRMVASNRSRSLPSLCSDGLLSSPHDILRLAHVMLPHLARARAWLRTDSLLCGHAIAYAFGETPDDGAAFLGFDHETRRTVLRLSASERFALSEALGLMESLETLSNESLILKPKTQQGKGVMQ